MKFRHWLIALPAVVVAVAAIAGTRVIGTWTPGSGITCDASNVCSAAGGGSLTVKDGGTTVSTVTTIDFTSGATVSSGGAGQANVAISGGGGGTVTSITAGTNVTISEGSPCTASCTINATGGGGSGGQYNQVMSATPTASSTGLSTFQNQGSATNTDGATGQVMTIPSGNTGFTALTKATPGFGTSLTITALIADGAHPGDGASNPSCWLGWYDGTKFEGIGLVNNGNGLYSQTRLNSTSSFNSNPRIDPAAPWVPLWVRIFNDGTNLKYYTSSDGANFALYMSNTITNFLANANNIALFGAHAPSDNAFCTIMSWTQS